MIEHSERVNEDIERAEQQAGVQLASIEELVECLQHAEECNDTAWCDAACHDVEEAREEIRDGALSVDVCTDWHGVGAAEAAKPTHYKILLCWGGPAVQIMGTLGGHNQPDSARLQYQDWFTPWMDYPLTEEHEQALMKYAREFTFDQ